MAISLRALAFGFAIALSPVPAFAEKPPISVELFQPAAVGGYDATSYFTGAPVKGAKEFSAQHRGATFYFANAANRDKFVANPSAYAPQYGGYCAWAVAEDKIAPGRPQYWKVVDGKLYLNYDAGVQKKWEKDVPGFIRKANKNWPTVLKK